MLVAAATVLRDRNAADARTTWTLIRCIDILKILPKKERKTVRNFEILKKNQ